MIILGNRKKLSTYDYFGYLSDEEIEDDAYDAEEEEIKKGEREIEGRTFFYETKHTLDKDFNRKKEI
jgi:hypothetical protein